MINIQYNNGLKTINSRSLNEVISDFNSEDKELQIIIDTFNKVNTKDELIHELRKFKNQIEPVSILLCLKAILNLSISEANPILEEILQVG
jgi:signal recognition particle GTPase